MILRWPRAAHTLAESLADPDTPHAEACRRLERAAARRQTVWLLIATCTIVLYANLPTGSGWRFVVPSLIGHNLYLFSRWARRRGEVHALAHLHDLVAEHQWKELSDDD